MKFTYFAMGITRLQSYRDERLYQKSTPAIIIIFHWDSSYEQL